MKIVYNFIKEDLVAGVRVHRGKLFVKMMRPISKLATSNILKLHPGGYITLLVVVWQAFHPCQNIKAFPGKSTTVGGKRISFRARILRLSLELRMEASLEFSHKKCSAAELNWFTFFLRMLAPIRLWSYLFFVKKCE